MTAQPQQLQLFTPPPPKPRQPRGAREATLAYLPAIRDLPPAERPINRLYKLGASALSTAELVAAILGTPYALHDAQRLLAHFGNIFGLARASLGEIEDQDGLGPITSARIKAALELGRRMLLAAPEERLTVRSPSDLAQILMAEMSHLEQEHFRVILLNTRNHVIDMITLYIGSLNSSHIRVGEVFREAIRRNAAAIIVAHNHPSGAPSPSPEDLEVTRRLVEAGDSLDIKVLDHLVIGQQRFVSLRERGLGFS